jgi:hypothetical protein
VLHVSRLVASAGSFQVEQIYTVTVTAMTSATAAASGVVAAKHDQADAVVKPQLRVTLPALPLGPAAIAVKLAGTTAYALTVADSNFTVAPPPSSRCRPDGRAGATGGGRMPSRAPPDAGPPPASCSSAAASAGSVASVKRSRSSSRRWDRSEP